MAFKTSVPRSKLETIASDQGCTVDVKASYVKITKGKSKNCLFVAKTVDVSRVDVGGFNVDMPDTVRSLGGESHGCVHQQLRSDIKTDAYIATYTTICANLDTYESHPKKEKARPHAFKGGKRKGVETVAIVIAAETPAETVERLIGKLTKLREVSEVMGIPVSQKTVRELNEQLEKARKSIAQ